MACARRPSSLPVRRWEWLANSFFNHSPAGLTGVRFQRATTGKELETSRLRAHAGSVSMERCARLACCKVGLDRPLIPTALVANLFRSARVSRSRPSAISFGEGLPTPPFGRPWVSR